MLFFVSFFEEEDIEKRKTMTASVFFSLCVRLCLSADGSLCSSWQRRRSRARVTRAVDQGERAKREKKKKRHGQCFRCPMVTASAGKQKPDEEMKTQ